MSNKKIISCFQYPVKTTVFTVSRKSFQIFPKYLKICREYSLNMAEAVDFSMPDAFAKDYLDRIIKKTEKSLNNTCILYTTFIGTNRECPGNRTSITV
jgi:hypothetical protein